MKTMVPLKAFEEQIKSLIMLKISQDCMSLPAVSSCIFTVDVCCYQSLTVYMI